MPDLSGLETGHEIRKLDKDVSIVYLTNYPNYIRQSLRIEIFDYLHKPSKLCEVNDVLARAFEKYKERHHLLALKCMDKDRASFIELHEVVFVEFDQKHVIFHMEERYHECVGSLREYEERLAPYGFIRCNRRELVNMKYIKDYEGSTLQLTTGDEIKMTARRKPVCIRAYSDYLLRYAI